MQSQGLGQEERPSRLIFRLVKSMWQHGRYIEKEQVSVSSKWRSSLKAENDNIFTRGFHMWCFGPHSLEDM